MMNEMPLKVRERERGRKWSVVFLMLANDTALFACFADWALAERMQGT